MERIRGDGAILSNINLAPDNVVQEVVQNVAMILGSIQNTCMMYRDFGMPGEAYHRPLQAVENLLVGRIYDQIQKYEPRAILSGVEFDRDDGNGSLIPVVVLEGVRENG
jgi:hypothetical protein